MQEVVWTPGQELVHWVHTRQLPIDLILKHLNWKDVVRLAAASPQLWLYVVLLVTLARPNLKVALDLKTPWRLRIPLLTGLTRAQVRALNNWVLRRACCGGRLAMAQWLAERFGLTAADARAQDNYALRVACAYGHLAVAQWLESEFGITRAEINQ